MMRSKELFNAPYFCKSQQPERFDLAEPIPGATTDALARLARELSVVLIVPLFERQAPGVYRNSAAIIDADGSMLGVYRKMHIPDDPLFNEKYYFTPGDAATDDRGDRIGAVAKQASGFRVWKTRFANVGVLKMAILDVLPVIRRSAEPQVRSRVAAEHDTRLPLRPY